MQIGRAAAISSAYFALWKVSVSYAQTVKATMPVFTVLISRLILGEHHSLKFYFSLVCVLKIM
jgi:solute carrier family 35 protein E1